MKLKFSAFILLFSFLVSCKPEVNNLSSKTKLLSASLSNRCKVSVDGSSKFRSNEKRNIAIDCHPMLVETEKPLIYEWEINNIKLPNTEKNIVLQNLSVGNYVLNTKISDGVEKTEFKTPFEVVAIDGGPLNCSLSPTNNTINFTIGGSATLSSNCKNTGVDYIWSLDNKILAGKNQSNLTISGNDLSVGDHTLRFEATLGKDKITSTWKLVLINSIVAPDLCFMSATPSGPNMRMSEDKTLKVVCSKGNNLTYTWKKSNISLSNLTDSLTLSGLSIGNYTFSVTVSNSSGNQTINQDIVVSDAIVAPLGCSINSNPSGTNMTTSESKNLTVTCSQGSNLSYVWKNNNTTLPNSTQNLNLSKLMAGNYSYSVIVSNSSGSQTINQDIVVSNAIIAPSGCTLSSNPSGTNMTTTESKTIKVSCSQGNNLSYAWKKNNLSLSSTTQSLSLMNLSAGNYTYSVTISNTSGSQTINQDIVVSNAVIVPSGCSIAAVPSTASIMTTESKTLTVNCSQGNNLGYAWFKNDSPLSGSSNLIQLSSLASGDYIYKAVVSNTLGKVEIKYSIKVNQVPQVPQVPQASSSKRRHISSGMGHTCLLKNGGVKCWGWNNSGQLGNGSILDSTIPVQVSGLESGVLEIGLGYYHSCALLISGAIKCWGNNQHGELGNNSLVNSSIPVQVQGLTSGIKSFSAHLDMHTCVILDSGEVKCWGYNFGGGLGNGNTVNSSIPVTVSGLSAGSGAILTETGSYSSCVVLNNGAVKCWGFGNGNGLELIPKKGLESGVEMMTLSFGGTICVLIQGKVKCQGSNSNGLLGNGSVDFFYQTSFSEVVGIGTGLVQALTSASSINCVLVAGAVKCWGSNEGGGLGNGSTVSSGTAVSMDGFTSGVQEFSITGDGMTACAIMSNGAVMCRGNNFVGQVGDGTQITRPTPVVVQIGP